MVLVATVIRDFDHRSDGVCVCERNQNDPQFIYEKINIQDQNHWN